MGEGSTRTAHSSSHPRHRPRSAESAEAADPRVEDVRPAAAPAALRKDAGRAMGQHVLEEDRVHAPLLHREETQLLVVAIAEVMALARPGEVEGTPRRANHGRRALVFGYASPSSCRSAPRPVRARAAVGNATTRSRTTLSETLTARRMFRSSAAPSSATPPGSRSGTLDISIDATGARAPVVHEESRRASREPSSGGIRGAGSPEGAPRSRGGASGRCSRRRRLIAAKPKVGTGPDMTRSPAGAARKSGPVETQLCLPRTSLRAAKLRESPSRAISPGFGDSFSLPDRCSAS